MNVEDAAEGLSSVCKFLADNPEYADPEVMEWLPSPEDRRIIKRLIADVLPTDITASCRDEILEQASVVGALFAVAVRRGITDKTLNELAISDANKSNESLRYGIRTGIDALLAAGRAVDKFNRRSKPFTQSIEQLAEKHGLSCQDNQLGDRLLSMLEDLRTTEIEAFKVPNVLNRNTKKAASDFDIALSKAIGKSLPTRAKSRLISEIRDALQLPAATPEMIYQRLQRARA